MISKEQRATKRRNLLAKVHIAKKELGLDDVLYRYILKNEYGVESSAALSIRELMNLVQRFESRGWKAKGAPKGLRSAQGLEGGGNTYHAEALKERIGQELLHSPLNEKRLRGLVKKICGVDELRWSRDTGGLKRLLVVINRINAQEKAKVCSN